MLSEKIGRLIPFLWWIFLILLVLCAMVCCIAQAACGFGSFWAICGAVGCGITLFILAIQAWGEWLDRNNY